MTPKHRNTLVIACAVAAIAAGPPGPATAADLDDVFAGGSDQPASHRNAGFYLGAFGALQFQEGLEVESRTVDLGRFEDVVDGDIYDKWRYRIPIARDSIVQIVRSAFETDSDTGGRFGGSIGYRLNSHLRFEAEASYGVNDSEAVTTISAIVPSTSGKTILLEQQDLDVGGNIKTFSVFANGWVDLPIDGHIRPYIGGGVGVAFLSGSGIDDDDKFTYQVGAGLTLPVTRSTDLYAGYRFQQVLNVEVDGSDAGDITNHVAEIGLRYNF